MYKYEFKSHFYLTPNKVPPALQLDGYGHWLRMSPT